MLVSLDMPAIRLSGTRLHWVPTHSCLLSTEQACQQAEGAAVLPLCYICMCSINHTAHSAQVLNLPVLAYPMSLLVHSRHMTSREHFTLPQDPSSLLLGPLVEQIQPTASPRAGQQG